MVKRSPENPVRITSRTVENRQNLGKAAESKVTFLIHEKELEALDDRRLAKLVNERSNQPLLDVDLDSYVSW